MYGSPGVMSLNEGIRNRRLNYCHEFLTTYEALESEQLPEEERWQRTERDLEAKGIFLNKSKKLGKVITYFM